MAALETGFVTLVYISHMLLKYEAIIGGEVEILQKFRIIVGFLERVTGGLKENGREVQYTSYRICNSHFKGWLVNERDIDRLW
jgi:hypothetical protein